MSDSFIDTTLDDTAMANQITSLGRRVVPGWRSVDPNKLKVSKISGGITNILLLVTVDDQNETQAVTVRIFGPNTEFIIDREREKHAVSVLSSCGFGAKLIGSFQNGFVQSYISGITLTTEDMRNPKMVPLIAKSIARFHKVNVPGPKEPQLWPTVQKYLKLAKSLTFEDPEKRRRFESIDFRQIEAEVILLKEKTSSLNSPIVFAHNDLLSGNFMYEEKIDRLHVIDFEYGAYSFRGYDLGNHFNEYAGFECDFTMYPNKEAQFVFFREYLSEGKDPQKVEEEDLEKLYLETNIFALVSHFFWGMWALIQEKYSPIDFDYLEYFFLRYEEYKKRKDVALKLLRSD